MRSFFLSKTYLYFIMALLFIALIVDFSLFLVSSLIFVFVLFILRKNKIILKDREAQGMILSPLNGFIKNVDLSARKIEISVSLLGPLGLYMPISGSVFDKNEKLVLNTYEKEEILLEINDGLIGRGFTWLEAGDIAKAGSNIGVASFKSSLFIYLPEKARILVNVNERVIAGQTVLAGL